MKDMKQKDFKELLNTLEKEADRLGLKGAKRARAVTAGIYLSVLGPVSTVSTSAPGLLVMRSKN